MGYPRTAVIGSLDSVAAAEAALAIICAVGEPMRGMSVKDMSVGNMLDGLFNITRDFDMKTQPHLLLLQKTMVMVEGVATALDPDILLKPTVRIDIQDTDLKRRT